MDKWQKIHWDVQKWFTAWVCMYVYQNFLNFIFDWNTTNLCADRLFSSVIKNVVDLEKCLVVYINLKLIFFDI